MFKIHDDNTMELIRGDSADFTISLVDSETGDEYILQPGDTIVFTIKKNTKTDEVLVQKQGPNVTIAPEDTEGLKYGEYRYDVELTYASGFVDTVVPPTAFTIDEEVTF